MGRRPLCQDTGIVNVFVKVGMNVQWQGDMSVTDMINEGVRPRLQASRQRAPCIGIG